MELSSRLYLMRHTGTHYQHTLDTSHISFRKPGLGREASNKRIHEKIIKKNLYNKPASRLKEVPISSKEVDTQCVLHMYRTNEYY